MYLVGISYSRKIKPFNVMVMGEMGSAKRIPIVIGDSELETGEYKLKNMRDGSELTFKAENAADAVKSIL